MVNKVVCELKETEDVDCEAQNNEQMLGLWRSGQVAMLGPEFSTVSVRPKVLLAKENTMNMFYLPRLSLKKELSELTKLIIAFVVNVKMCPN